MWTASVARRFMIDMFTGDTAGAVVWVDSLLHLPGGLTPALLSLHPGFAPLREDPRFQRLLAGE